MPDLPAWHKRCLEIGLLEVIPGVQDNHLLEGPGPCFMIWIYLDYCKREVSLRQEKKELKLPVWQLLLLPLENAAARLWENGTCCLIDASILPVEKEKKPSPEHVAAVRFSEVLSVSTEHLEHVKNNASENLS